jgi:hypothetical protein
MTDANLYSLMLIRRLSPQTDRMIDNVEAIPSESEAVALAERRAKEDPSEEWTHCAIIRPNNDFRHGVRRQGSIVWDVLELP